jgi:transcriptional antiterminator
MEEISRKDCISFKKVMDETKVSRNTLNNYLNALGIAKLKFPFDNKVYISRTNYNRLQEFLKEKSEAI